MGGLKLTYHNQQRALEVNPLFIERGLGKKRAAEKNCVSAYRYGFNGHEKDDEVKGNGNHLAFGDYGYDPRIGRWLSLDPLQSEYPSLSPYNFVGNNPILNKDLDGKKIYIYYDSGKKGKWNQVIYTAFEYKGALSPPNNPYVTATISALDKLGTSKFIAIDFDRMLTSTTFNYNLKEVQGTKVNEADGHTFLNPETNKFDVMAEQDLYFNPGIYLIGKNGKILPPYAALWHEMGHLLSAAETPAEYRRRSTNYYGPLDPMKVWETEEEYYNTTRYEWPLAMEFGLLIRQDHENGTSATAVFGNAPASRTPIRTFEENIYDGKEVNLK